MQVYLIFDKATKLTKIGKSISPSQRFNELRVGNRSIELVYHSNKYTEDELHTRYNNKRVSGEWFMLSLADYKDIIGNIKGLPKSIYYRNGNPKFIKDDVVNFKTIKDTTVTIIRQANGVGIDKYLNGYDMTDFRLLKRKVYNGRLCYILNGKPVGYSTIKKNRCNIAITDTCPF